MDITYITREPKSTFTSRLILNTLFFFMLLLYAGIVVITLLDASPPGTYITLTYIQLGQTFLWAFILAASQSAMDVVFFGVYFFFLIVVTILDTVAVSWRFVYMLSVEGLSKVVFAFGWVIFAFTLVLFIFDIVVLLVSSSLFGEVRTYILIINSMYNIKFTKVKPDYKTK